jgi:septation ring formation regulator EzrA
LSSQLTMFERHSFFCICGTCELRRRIEKKLIEDLKKLKNKVRETPVDTRMSRLLKLRLYDKYEERSFRLILLK